MKTEKQKMLAGELYDALDPQLSEERTKARLLLQQLNNSREDYPIERARILREPYLTLAKAYSLHSIFIFNGKGLNIVL
ncbi:hypothetical protein H7F15_14045 [Pontibacter sp. Tf4]|uniref:maltose acetyltransferase domain-containing protein n=1 Tax=Pontibacter sp. Tf4 TaxID=2761620 RepID=UPI001627A3B3|nr:hypothetical protein [Pontibacter sp. Tf4]